MESAAQATLTVASTSVSMFGLDRSELSSSTMRLIHFGSARHLAPPRRRQTSQQRQLTQIVAVVSPRLPNLVVKDPKNNVPWFMSATAETVTKVLKSMAMSRFSADLAGRLMNDASKVLVYLATSFCDYLEERVLQLLGNEDSCDGDTCYFLLDHYAPVPEMAPTTNLPVFGSIPACLDGEFLRIGPNPRFQPLNGYHWHAHFSRPARAGFPSIFTIDGDGMIHGLRVKDGKASYVARYVQTSRLQQEEMYGGPKFIRVGDLQGMRGLSVGIIEALRKTFGVLDGSKGDGTGNTAMVFHNNKLLALHERDLPYIIKVQDDGDLQTVGHEDFDHKLRHPFTAHPKINPVTGEMHFFAYEVVTPHLIYRMVSKDGVVGEPVPITLPGPSVMHDFAITENYAVFFDLPLHINVAGLFCGDSLFKFDRRKEARLGLLPRYAKNESQIRWFEIPPCYISHTQNAWEEGDEVVLICCRNESFDIKPLTKSKRENGMTLGSRLFEFRMNLKDGKVTQRELSNLCTEFPRINEEYTGRRTRYGYCSVFDDEEMIIGVAKYDLTMEPSPDASRELKVGGNIVGVFHYGQERTGHEAIFVPRNPGSNGLEDDGYLIAYVHDNTTGKSDVVIIDAITMKAEPVAVVKLPRRVPLGFHAYFVSQEQLLQQA